MVAHSGIWKCCGRSANATGKLRLHILVHTKHAERFNRMLKRINPHIDERLLQVTELDATTIAYLSHRVDEGDFVRDRRRSRADARRSHCGCLLPGRSRTVSDRTLGYWLRARVPA